jgi:integrase
MTYRPNGPEDPGHLRKIGKEWWFHIPPDQFKNERGAAAEPYIVRIPQRLWPLLDQYTTEWRPRLRGADTSDRLFLPSSLGLADGERVDLTQNAGLQSNWMGQLVTKLTRAYIDKCPGFGPHAFRHIIATDYLKVHPNGHVAAAAILHDTVATVLRDYAHLRVADSYEFYAAHYSEMFGESGST